MKRWVLASGLNWALLFGTRAQFPPKREGITVLQSKFHENVNISFKEPGICETTPGVKSYSGYVHLPPHFLGHEDQDYPINTFFWFFEARKDPGKAPLAIWLNGGPGGSSMMGALEENGPCFVGPDSKSTYLNPWSWNNEVNMLYIDQPVQTGFSYDVLTNVTIRLDERGEPVIIPTVFKDGQIPETNYTYQIGTLGSQKMSQTTNTTERAAHALWHFMQTWFFEFPHYKPDDNRISLWAESYGGHYGPAFFRFFQEQNEKITRGSLDHSGAHYLHIDTLGIVNGAIDSLAHGEACFEFPYNNTYGVQLYNHSLHASLMHNWTRPSGWRDQTAACAAALNQHDPPDENTTALCASVYQEVFLDACLGSFAKHAARALYDIAQPSQGPFPPPHLHGYLTRSAVLAALGVPVNYSATAQAVNRVFDRTFDLLRGGLLDAIAYLLDRGLSVHLVYGDRDFIANWVGGERSSLAVPHRRRRDFAGAGYSPLVVGEEDAGPREEKGLTRQLGRFSFTRLFQAGHEAPAYQGQAAYEVFRRAVFGWDIPTGRVMVTDAFRTEGPRDAWGVREELPEMPKARCYVLKPESCEEEVWKTVMNGTAVVRDWFVVQDGDGKGGTGSSGGIGGDEL
ncbi:Lysosomal protective protein [Madurella fahalii]|uniref:Carboxypeptidase n=1 Tax=Madurella fahalii TaxID=1157608 RepID=A0ABQ0GHF0_9PEZI